MVSHTLKSSTKKKFDFLKESLRTLRTTGAVVPSSRYLVREMLKPIDFNNAKVIVELGAGDGIMTVEILKHMKADCQLLCFEINPEFCQILKENIQDARFVLIQDSAEYVEKYLIDNGFEQADYIVSAIPFVMLPDELTYKIVGNCQKVLKKSGLYIQFHYSMFIQRMYKRFFGNVDVNFVPLNIPPAFVMVCRKD